MAGKKLNFAIAINMTTDQFRKGADLVKSALKGIQYQVLGMASALGFGVIGLNSLIKEFVHTARETNRARIALSNISEGATGFAQNLNFLTKTAQKYGQEIDGITITFARFSAASNAVGVSLQDQYKIYDAMTKAITAFGLTSSEAQLTYMALGQMMSKGKITAEELRRQMGERIPIAMEAMARAANVSMKELDAMLKRGEVYSAKVLPRFADELNNMLGDINVDNIETSLNRLRNSFILLTEDLKVGDFYKKILDGLNKLISNIQNTWQRFVATIAAAIVSGKISKAIQKFSEQAAAQEARLVANAQTAEKQKELAVQKRIAATKSFEEIDREYQRADLNQKAQMYSQHERAKTNMTKAQNRARAAIRNAEAQQEELRLYRSTSLWQKAGASIKSTMVGVFASIGGMLKTLVPVAIIGALTNFLMKLREIRKESERINNLFNDYKEGINNLDLGREATQLNAALEILTDKKSTQEQINSAQNTLNKLLGTEIKNQDVLIDKTKERLKYLRASSDLQYYTDESAKAKRRIEEIERSREKRKEDNAYFNISEEGVITVSEEKFKPKTLARILREKWKTKKEVAAEDAELKQQQEIFNHANQKIKELIELIDGFDIGDRGGGIGGDDDKKPSEDLKKVEQKYVEGMTSLNNQIAAEAISKKEYNEAVNKLNEATYKEIAGILGADAINNKIYQKAKQGVLNPLPVESSEDLERAEQKYIEEMAVLNNLLAAEVISKKEYGKAVDELNKATYKEIAGILGINAVNNEIYQKAKQGVLSPLYAEPYRLPEKDIRDTTFDYKKSEVNKLEELYRIQKQYVDALKSDIEKLEDEATDAINVIDSEMEKLDSLSEALKLAELREDIETLSEDIFKAQVSGAVDFANALDSIARSWNRIANEDMSGFERMVALINALGDTIGGVMRLWEGYSKIQDMIALKEGAQAAKQKILAGQKLAADQAEAISAQTKSATVVAGLKAEQKAATGVMAAKSTAAYADMPFVGAGLAAAQIASMQALIAAASAIPQFAHGGIVGGTTKTGDKQLIRANSGEMILTTAQQSNLWNAIRNNKFGESSGELKVTIKGKDLVGVLKNNNQLQNRM